MIIIYLANLLYDGCLPLRRRRDSIDYVFETLTMLGVVYYSVVFIIIVNHFVVVILIS